MIAGVTHLPTIYASSIYPMTPDTILSKTYQPLTERFQYYLQDLGRASGYRFNGIIICDQRNPNQDKMLSGFHHDLLKAENRRQSQYANLVEHLFLSPSHYSIGIQFADLIAGSVYRYFEHADERWFRLIKPSFRRDPRNSDVIDGYGLVRVPKGVWKENDAESRTGPEPATMTQSQRTPNHT